MTRPEREEVIVDLNKKQLAKVRKYIDGIEYRNLGHLIDIALKNWLNPMEDVREFTEASKRANDPDVPTS